MTIENRVHRFAWAVGDNPQIWIVHFGSKSTPLIAQLCREIGFQSLSMTPEVLYNKICAGDAPPKLIILSGGNQSVYDDGSPSLPEDVYTMIRGKTCLLGICYGAQLLAKIEGGEVTSAGRAEYGMVRLDLHSSFGTYRGGRVVMNHGDEVTRLPAGWSIIGSTDRCRHAFVGNEQTWGVQFHPEMDHTEDGESLLREIARLAGLGQDYAFNANLFIDQAAAWLNERPYHRIICGLSGGVDSAVAFRLAQQAYGDRVHGIFVNTGWMRAGETEEVRAIFGDEHITYLEAADIFNEAIEAVPYPSSGGRCEREYLYYEAVRKIIGRVFIQVFVDEAKRLGGAEVLIQGTNAADIIESQTGLKSHHNLALPDMLEVAVLEPLAGLYKVEIRKLAIALGLPEEIAYRQPFPGPGLTLRNWGKLDRTLAPLLQHGNQILEEVVRKHYPQHAHRPCQYYVAPQPLPSTGIMGDERVVGYSWMVRMVAARTRESYASLDVFRPSTEFDEELVHRLTTETRHPDGSRFVSVVRNITPKPPSTTEPH